MPLFYKGTNNLKCRDQVYEINKTYSIPPEDVRMCIYGFHFCKTINDIHLFYSLHHTTTVVIEIEVNKEDIIDVCDEKLVASKIKIIRIVPKEEYEKLSNGEFKWGNNQFERILESGHWTKWEYDENQNLIKVTNANGFFRKWEYNEHNQPIRSINSSGFTGIWEYCKNKKFAKYNGTIIEI